ncbi:MAG: baseplate J/gp47 family protein [Deltaproteobacteria bacterium]|nr:baseplate J/gp47 family protein [Deltaproteobacteria bacterium]
MTQPDFEAMVSGLPADQADVEAQLRSDLQAQGSRIANTSPFSPFFKLLGAIFGTPVLWIRDWIKTELLPGMFMHTATGAWADLRAADYDEVRTPASKAAGLLTFYRDGTTGILTIPGGTVVETAPLDGVVYRMIVDADTDIPDGQSSVQATCTAEAEGQAYNLGDGYYQVLPVAVPGVTQVANEAGWLTTPGRDLETDEEMQVRVPNKWLTQSGQAVDNFYRTHIVDAVPSLKFDNIWILKDPPPRGAGSANAYLLTDTGIPSQSVIDAAHAYVNDAGYHGLGDDVWVLAMPTLAVDIDVTITANASLDATEMAALQANVENMLRAIFRDSTAYPEYSRVAPNERVSRSAIAGWLHDEFIDIEAVTWTTPAADPEPGMEVPVINTLSVTVS